MAAPRRKRPPFIVVDGRLLVETRHSGIHPLVILTDGFALTLAGKKRERAYAAVEDIVAWHRKELAESNGRSGSKLALDAFEHVLEKFKAGNIEYVD